MWSTASSSLWFSAKITVVFSNCCGTRTQGGFYRRDVCCRSAWEVFSWTLDSWEKATLYSLLFFPFPTSSLSFLCSRQTKWVFERRLKKKKKEIPFSCFLPMTKQDMPIVTCTTSPTFLPKEMNLCWHANIRCWDSNPDAESSSFV